VVGPVGAEPLLEGQVELVSGALADGHGGSPGVLGSFGRRRPVSDGTPKPYSRRHLMQALVRTADGVAAAVLRARTHLGQDGLIAEVDRRLTGTEPPALFADRQRVSVMAARQSEVMVAIAPMRPRRRVRVSSRISCSSLASKRWS
jgi:hypothetical protein